MVCVKYKPVVYYQYLIITFKCLRSGHMSLFLRILKDIVQDIFTFVSLQFKLAWESFWYAFDRFASILDHLDYALVITVTVFILVGVLMLLNYVKIHEDDIELNKFQIWLRCSLLISAFLVSGTFREVALLTIIFGLFVESDKNWKYAIAIVLLLSTLFRN